MQLYRQHIVGISALLVQGLIKLTYLRHAIVKYHDYWKLHEFGVSRTLGAKRWVVRLGCAIIAKRPRLAHAGGYDPHNSVLLSDDIGIGHS